MRIEDLAAYSSNLGGNLAKLEMKAEDDTCGHMTVVETKETYVFENEGEADEKINSSIANPSCLAHTKKYKQGKINKSGEVVRPETWTVVVKLGH